MKEEEFMSEEEFNNILKNAKIKIEKREEPLKLYSQDDINEKDKEIERLKNIIDKAYKEAKKQDEEADFQEETDLSIIVNILKGSDKE